MNIGIDGKTLAVKGPGGLKNYATELIHSLSQIDKVNQYFIFSIERVNIPKKDNFHLVQIPRIPLLKRKLFFPYLVGKHRIDVLHFLDPHGSILFGGAKAVSTVVDLIFEDELNISLNPIRAFKRFASYLDLQRTLSASRAFITASKAVSRELEFFLRRHGKKEKIYITPFAVNARFKPLARSIKRKNFMCLGDRLPRKNTEKIIEAYKELPDEVKKSHRLLIIASPAFPVESSRQIIQKLKLVKFIKLVKTPSNKKLVKLYNQAFGFLYPSLYEGFGFPILEAMACGCPVVTSNYGAMKEVAGGAAYLVNPDSVKEIAGAMEALAKNKKLVRSLAQKGLQRARSFYWQKTARRTLEVYEEVFKS